MRNLCLVSRHLRQVVEPILSQEFMLGHGEPRWYRHYTWDRRLTAFMRTVTHRRDLASLVKQIYIHPHLIRDFGYAQFYGTDYSEKGQNTLREVAQALERDALRSLSVGDLLAGLMTDLPNLEHLSLHIGLPVHSILGSAGLRAARVSQLPIETIDICFGASPSYIDGCFA